MGAERTKHPLKRDRWHRSTITEGRSPSIRLRAHMWGQRVLVAAARTRCREIGGAILPVVRPTMNANTRLTIEATS